MVIFILSYQENKNLSLLKMYTRRILYNKSLIMQVLNLEL